MSDTREEFEKALNDCILETQCMLNYDEAATRDIALFIWQAQQAKIDTLTEKLAFQDRWLSNGVYFTNEEYGKEVCKIRALEARCKELTEALLDLSFECFDVFGTKKPTIDTYNRTLIIAQPTTPQEALDRFENEVIEKFRKDMARTSRMTYKAKKEVK